MIILHTNLYDTSVSFHILSEFLSYLTTLPLNLISYYFIDNSLHARLITIKNILLAYRAYAIKDHNKTFVVKRLNHKLNFIVL